MAFENLVLPKEIKAEQESATYGKVVPRKVGDSL